jgi:hypothetical protein
MEKTSADNFILCYPIIHTLSCYEVYFSYVKEFILLTTIYTTWHMHENNISNMCVGEMKCILYLCEKSTQKFYPKKVFQLKIICARLSLENKKTSKIHIFLTYRSRYNLIYLGSSMKEHKIYVENTMK